MRNIHDFLEIWGADKESLLNAKIGIKVVYLESKFR